MKTTMLAVELLVAGTLVLLALVFLAASFFPAEAQATFDALGGSSGLFPADSPTLAVIFVAMAYAMGVLSEFAGYVAFEWLHNRVRARRLAKYLKDNHPNLEKSPILRKYAKVPIEKISVPKDDTRRCIGEMRFHVLMESPTLYQEVESQLNRMRLIRVLFLVEVILALAIIGQLSQATSPALTRYLLAFAVVAAALNVVAIIARFHRYCRAVERAYKALVLDPPLHPSSEPDSSQRR